MNISDNSVDAQEIARFQAIGGQWWDPTGPMRALHKLNPTRMAWIGSLLSNLGDGKVNGGLKGLRILDIGCGGGLLSESLAKLGADVVGIDPNPDIVDVARAHARQDSLKIDYRATTVEALGAEGALFDAVCAMEVVEHVVEPAPFVEAACGLVRPGGWFFAATLNRTLKSFGLAIVGAEYILRWAPKGTHQWEKFVSPDELEQAMENAGVPVRERTGVVFSPLSGRWTLSRDMSVNYMLAGRRG